MSGLRPGRKTTCFPHHNEIVDVTIESDYDIKKFNCDAESPRSFKPFEPDMWIVDGMYVVLL